MKGKRRGVFGELIFLLSAALVVLLVFLTVILFQVHRQQISADEDYFRRQVQTTTKNLQSKLAEIKMVAAELNVSESLQKFLTTSDILTRYQYRKALSDIQKIFLAQNNLVSFLDMYRPDGERYTAFYTDFLLSRAVQENIDLSDTQDRNSYFLFLNTNQSHNYANYVYLSPILAQTTAEKLGTIALFGLSGNLARGDEYTSIYLRDTLGRTWPGPIPDEYDAEAELAAGLTAYFIHTKAYVDTALSDYINTLFIVLAMMLGTLLLTGILLVRQLTHPVRRIIRQLEDVKKGERNTVSIHYGGAELIQLSGEINSMLENIQQRNQENIDIHDKLYQAELARVQTSLYALRSQINPHFLYNTLQTVRGMAICHQAPEIARIATNMAYIFRYSIREDPLARADEEMTTARKYMEIMNARQDNRFLYIESMEPEIAHCMVPRMIIQPVIENAVKYAFEGQRDQPRITVCWRREKDDILAVVQDNGSGMTEEALVTLRKKMEQPFSPDSARETGGIGLHNIHQRLRLRYGDTYGAVITRNEEGLSVMLRMPYHTENTE